MSIVLKNQLRDLTARVEMLERAVNVINKEPYKIAGESAKTEPNELAKKKAAKKAKKVSD